MDILLLLRQSLRALSRRPAYSLLVVATLGLAIGADTALFSVVETVLLQPLPYRDPDRMVLLREESSVSPMVPMTPNEVEHLDRTSRTLESLVALDPVSFHVRGEEGAEQVPGALVTADFFDAFGVQPALGRGFVDARGRADGEIEGIAPVLITDELWRTRHGADPGVLGARLDMEFTAMFGPRRVLPERFEIVGVLPAGFVSPFAAPQIFAPLRYPEGEARLQGSYLFPFGRLADGETLASAKAELDLLLRSLGPEGLPSSVDPETVGVTVLGLQANRVGRVESALWMLFAAVTIVLLVACANVASLSLVRLAERRPELALRRALGADRRRLVAGPLVESLLLALAGGAAGLGVAWVGVRWLRDAATGQIPGAGDVDIDAAATGFAAAVALGTVLLFGLLPAWVGSRRVDSGAGRIAGGSQRLRSGLVALEIGLALVLLVGAGLLVRSFQQLGSVDLGFETERLVTFEVALPARYSERGRRAEVQRAIREQVAAIAGVRSAAVTSSLPLTPVNTATRLEIAGYEDPEGRTPFASYRDASAELFDALGVPLLAGRTFEEGDTLGEPRSVVVNRAFAELYLGGGSGAGATAGSESAGDDAAGFDPTSVLGRALRLIDVVDAELEVVGVVGDVRDFGPARPARPTAFVPRLGSSTAGYALRTEAVPEAVFAAIRAAVAAVDPRLPVQGLRTFESAASRWLGAPLFNTWLMGLFSVLGLVLAVVGLFGLVAYSVRQRRREIGVRMALGALGVDVLLEVLADASKPIGAGLALGVVAAIGASRLLESQLFGVEAIDPLTFAGSAMLLAAVAVIAALVPARRATRVDPVSVLRDR
ncbi:MAG TPA: ADOP family duplicated permease [Thermoanaerobaculia bacterium]|nr:ADOP family duplicated permease [Thermoanaerobaculia bacterium]